MKKILFSALFLIAVSALFAAPVSANAAVAGREDWPVFDVVEGENSTATEVKSADKRQTTAWRTVYIATIPAGAVCAAGLGALFIVIRKKRKTQPKNVFGTVSGILAVAFVFTAVCGTGIFGLAGLLEDNYKPAYYYAGASESKDPAPDGTLGFTGNLLNRKILSTFDFGVENKYDRVYSNFPHFWNASEPKHNYATLSLGAKYAGRYEYSYEEDDGDGANVWYVLPAEDASDAGDGFYADAEYRLTMNSSDGETNYVDTSLYDKLRLVFRAENPNNPVNLTIIADTRRKEAADEGDLSPVRYTLGTYSGKSGDKVEITVNTGVIKAEDRPYLSRIIFRTENSHIKPGDKNAYQKNSIYYLELFSTVKTVSSGKIVGTNENAGTTVTMTSEYLGSLGYGLLGAYSASGFYDRADRKWKVWYGAGIPENIASDNVYYTETTDPAKGWSKPVRLILNDPTGMLCAANKAPGYGGDPSVVKVDGTYYMFFSGLEKTPSPPNKIYLATSADGLNYTVYGPVVDVEKMG
ncbi:MAG: hypothetical protein IJU84_06965, partial [Clostridia bacterium]|nr:hypothetical protein [Clostridia bacterium]